MKMSVKRIVLIRDEVFYIGDAERNLITTRKENFNYSNPQVGDRVHVYQNGGCTVVDKIEWVDYDQTQMNENSSLRYRPANGVLKQDQRTTKERVLNARVSSGNMASLTKLMIFLIALVATVTVISLITSVDDGITEPSGNKGKTTVEMDAANFAEDNGISVGLAESVQDALAHTDNAKRYSLNDLSGWEQIEGWSEGNRYAAYIHDEDYWAFYVKDDKCVTIRSKSGILYNTYEIK